jgi:hypothetical protein
LRAAEIFRTNRMSRTSTATGPLMEEIADTAEIAVGAADVREEVAEAGAAAADVTAAVVDVMVVVDTVAMAAEAGGTKPIADF